jgi:hypothetical protein
MDISPTALFSYLLDDLREVGFSNFTGADDYWPGASPRDVACLRLARSLFKKLNDEVEPEADERCLKKFLHSDELCRNWELITHTTKDEELVGLFQDEVDRFLHPMGEPLVQSYFDILCRGKAGPGASLGAKGTDFYTKFFASKLSATSSTLYNLYNEYVCWFPTWVDAELSRSLNLGTLDIVRGNRLSFVRKTRDISRSICTEPSLNMYFQLGLGEIIGDRLKRYFGIDLSDQPEKNRAMARRGSIDGTLCTIDLESASDSVSMRLCAQFLPEWFYTILEELRSPEVSIDGQWRELNMVSSMGNGFTFPLQTMLFSCVVRAVVRWHRGEGSKDHSLFGVFGDDIICHSDYGDDVCRLLSILGFRINRTKSYFVGPFRESCGADFYEGQPVRGVYIRSLLTQQDRYVAINRLNEWSAVTGVNLPRTVGYLVDSVRNLAVPFWEQDTAGIRTWTPPPGSWHGKGQRYLYRRFEPITREIEVSESGAFQPVRSFWGEPPKRRITNPQGLILAFLSGHIRNCRISLSLKQGEKTRYRTRSVVSPYWAGYRPGSAFAADPCFWTSRVIEALDFNLNS